MKIDIHTYSSNTVKEQHSGRTRKAVELVKIMYEYIQICVLCMCIQTYVYIFTKLYNRV